jgi:hypothetical protein
MQRMTRGEVVYRLPGEPDDSAELAEVEHWQFVHRELVIACDEMLGQLPSQGTNIRLRARRDELAFRLAHWIERRRQLGLL